MVCCHGRGGVSEEWDLLCPEPRTHAHLGGGKKLEGSVFPCHLMSGRNIIYAAEANVRRGPRGLGHPPYLFLFPPKCLQLKTQSGWPPLTLLWVHLLYEQGQNWRPLPCLPTPAAFPIRASIFTSESASHFLLYSSDLQTLWARWGQSLFSTWLCPCPSEGDPIVRECLDVLFLK